jgi:predicted ATPase/DNA-binding winged helix-turn-helix (wHTH) protein
MSENNPREPAKALTFGPFRLLPEQRLLLEGDRRVEIGGRALSILIELIQHPGEVVGRKELLARVWPDTFVDEGNLRVHVSALRHALRDDRSGNRYVVNVPGQGYSFVGQVQSSHTAVEGAPAAAALDQPKVQPSYMMRVIGRSAVVDSIGESLRQHRFITLIGPGGIGKTTVAVAVANKLASAYRDHVSFIDLGSVTNVQLVPSTLAAVLGLAIPSENALPAVANFLERKNLLLVLDNCEHVIEAAAAAAEQIFSRAPNVHILATSREPLRVVGEHVHRLSPLEFPPASADLTAAQALAFPGIELLIERVAATMDGFELSDADAPVAAEICRRLDGIALAIELAAGRVAALGLRGVLACLDDRFRILTNGRRTALSRHQTLTATLDWSYDLLSDEGRRLLRRLAAFSGEFTLSAAAALFGGGELSRVVTELAELVSKSLVAADVSAEPRYRLLDTTRLYGIEKLKQSDELQETRGLHAEYFRCLFAGAEAACETLPQSKWLATYTGHLDNVRSALDWAASETGEPGTYVALTIGAIPLWVQLSLMSECHGRVVRALELVAGESTGRDRHQMQLHAARAWALMYGDGDPDDVNSAWETTRQLAEQLGDTDYRLRAFWGLWINRANKGDFAEALNLAGQLGQVVRRSTDTLSHILVDRLLGTTSYYRGDQTAARRYLERMLNEYAAIGNQPPVARFQVNPRGTAQYFLSRVLWLQGFPDQAMRLTETNIAEGLAIGHALSFGNILGQGACPIALFSGDLVAARRYSAMLVEHETKHGLHIWRNWVSCFEGLLTIMEGDVESGLAMVDAALDKAGQATLMPRYTALIGEFAACLGRTGSATRGLEMIEALITRCEAREEYWYAPEALRIKGELIVLNARPDAVAAAETLFSQAIVMARQQAARSWELRALTSKARLTRGQNSDAEPLARLSDILRGLSEGFETADVQRAKALLAGTGASFSADGIRTGGSVVALRRGLVRGR